MIFVSGIMQQDNNEQVILEPKLIAKQYIRSNPFSGKLQNSFIFYSKLLSLETRQFPFPKERGIFVFL
jgi:hypothetical protein